MNRETLLEAYNDLMRNYTKAQNKLQDIGFALAEQFVSEMSEGDCLKEISKIWGRD